MEKLILNEALPIVALSELGLYVNGRHLLSEKNIKALLSGRRTSMLSLKNLKSDTFVIEGLEAKLSLGKEGATDAILVHPVYREPKICAELEAKEGWAMIANDDANVAKVIKNSTDDSTRTLIFEYDSETKEFLSYSPSQVIVPIQVNGELLEESKRLAFAHGKLIEMADGTKIQYRASEPNGIIANTPVLILTIAGSEAPVSYLVLEIHPLKDYSIQQSPFTASFEAAYIEMERTENSLADREILKDSYEEFKNEYNRDYGAGHSR